MAHSLSDAVRSSDQVADNITSPRPLQGTRKVIPNTQNWNSGSDDG
jgi:hypothetical protein